MVIRSYDYPASLSKGAPIPSTKATAAEASASAVAATRPKPEASVTTALPTRKETTGVKSVSPLFSEVQTVANLPGVSLITDFLNYGDQLLMASSNGKQIQIFDITNNLKTIARGAPSYPVRILSLKWWTPGGNDGLYLAANVWSDRDKKVRGNLFRLYNGSIRSMIENIPRILGSFDSNGDGRPELLIGQEFEGETFFGRRLSELKLSGDNLSYSKPRIKFPRHFTVLGSIFAQENAYQNCLILNEEKNVVEALNGNVFIVKGNIVITPSLDDGCLRGIIRKQIISIVRQLEEFEFEERSVAPFELLKADEIFITNVMIGIRPVNKYRNKNYGDKVARQLLPRLNALMRSN